MQLELQASVLVLFGDPLSLHFEVHPLLPILLQGLVCNASFWQQLR